MEVMFCHSAILHHDDDDASQPARSRGFKPAMLPRPCIGVRNTLYHPVTTGFGGVFEQKAYRNLKPEIAWCTGPCVHVLKEGYQT
jgi:hypothetical protein